MNQFDDKSIFLQCELTQASKTTWVACFAPAPFLAVPVARSGDLLCATRLGAVVDRAVIED